MPRRDPNTGKFVSGSSVSWTDTTRITAVMHSNIPAADLAGGKVSAPVTGDNAEFVNFSKHLDHDEMFRLLSIDLTAVLALPTTATAESAGEVTYVLSRAGENSIARTNSPFFNGNIHREQGIVDLTASDGETAETLAIGELQASNSLRDTATGTAAGADIDRDRRVIHFGGRGPAFDRDDEIYVPHEFDVDGISDHAVDASWHALLHGVVEDA